MKNAEVIANDLITAIAEDDYGLLECVSDYIACPSENDCKYDGGKDLSPCVECKANWLRKEFD